MSTNVQLKSIQVKDVLPNKKVVYGFASATLPHILKELIENKIYSMPIRDETTGDFYGFLTLLDLITYITQLFPETSMNQPGFFSHLISQEKHVFQSTEAQNLVDLARRNPIIPVTPDVPLNLIFQLFGEKHIHALPIVDPNTREIMGILTQSDLISYLWKHKEYLGQILNYTIHQLSLGLKPVVSMSSDVYALEGFRLMAQHRINSVALVNPEGSIISNLSAKDIKALSTDALFPKLFQPGLGFISQSRFDDTKAFSGLISCKISDTVEKVLGKLAATHVHRLYVVDDFNKPIGVISLGDLLTIFTRLL